MNFLVKIEYIFLQNGKSPSKPPNGLNLPGLNTWMTSVIRFRSWMLKNRFLWYIVRECKLDFYINIYFSSAGNDFNFVGAHFKPMKSNKQPLNPPHHNRVKWVDELWKSYIYKEDNLLTKSIEYHSTWTRQPN